MTTQITIYGEPERNLSPYQERQAGAFDFINNDFLGKGGLSFKSVFDTVNPLQQLPVISTAYRTITSDTISTGSRLLGGALLGGPIGFAVALMNEIVSGSTGMDIGGNLVAAISDKYKAINELVPEKAV